MVDWQVIVTVLDDNDHPPVFSSSKYTFYVSEGVSIGSSVGIVSATDGDEGQNAVISFFTNDNNGSKCPCFKWVLNNESDRNARVRGEGGRNAVRIRYRNWVALSFFLAVSLSFYANHSVKALECVFVLFFSGRSILKVYFFHTNDNSSSYLVWIHEIHGFELRMEKNFKCMIPAVMRTTWVEARQRPEEFNPERDSNPELCDAGTLLFQ